MPRLSLAFLVWYSTTAGVNYFAAFFPAYEIPHAGCGREFLVSQSVLLFFLQLILTQKLHQSIADSHGAIPGF
jgi:hypothetical protein